MQQIQKLPESLINQIAAGEVVESPFSVVKELVENSIDAAASKIMISVKNGGRDFIQVLDDGKGMSEADCRLSVERHLLVNELLKQKKGFLRLHLQQFD